MDNDNPAVGDDRGSEMLALGDEIAAFLQSCGGPYATLAPTVELNIAYALGTEQYVYVPGEFYACYWRVHPEDVADALDRRRPARLTTGSVMYVVEAASKVGLVPLIRALRARGAGMQGVFWHRPAKKDMVFYFPKQEGHHG